MHNMLLIPFITNRSCSHLCWLTNCNTCANIDQSLMLHRRDLHTVIVDCAPIGFMDAVGVRTLIQVSKWVSSSVQQCNIK